MSTAMQWRHDQVPAEWLCAVTVTRGGRTVRGETVPPQTFGLDPVLVGWSSSTEQAWNESPADEAVLILEVGQRAIGQAVPFQFERGDVVDIPAGPRPSGRWRVHGSPQPGPMGTTIELRKAT